MELTEEIIRIFNFLGSLICHQIRERTLEVGGHYLPVCSRDTGAYIGLLVGYTLVILFRRKKARGLPNLYLTLSMMLPLLIDSFSQLLGFWTSTNDIRLLTGLLFGTAMAPLLVYVLSLQPLNGKIPLLKNIQPSTPVLDSNDSWLDARSLFLGAAFSCVLFVAIKSVMGIQAVFVYWVLSMPIVAVIIWHIFILPLLMLIAPARHLSVLVFRLATSYACGKHATTNVSACHLKYDQPLVEEIMSKSTRRHCKTTFAEV